MSKYYVNEVPVAKKDYEAKISSITDENLFKIITNPLFFNENMKWQDRRAILLNLCENITDEELLAKDEKFAPLSAELKGRTIQEYKKIIQSKQAGINTQQEMFNSNITERLEVESSRIDNLAASTTTDGEVIDIESMKLLDNLYASAKIRKEVSLV